MTNSDNAFSSEERQYQSPEAEVVFVNMQSVLCISDPPVGGIPPTEMDEGDCNW